MGRVLRVGRPGAGVRRCRRRGRGGVGGRVGIKGAWTSESEGEGREYMVRSHTISHAKHLQQESGSFKVTQTEIP